MTEVPDAPLLRLHVLTTRFYYEVLLRPFNCPLLRQTRCPLSQRVLQPCLELPGRLYGPSIHITSRYNADVVLVDPPHGARIETRHTNKMRPRFTNIVQPNKKKAHRGAPFYLKFPTSCRYR